MNTPTAKIYTKSDIDERIELKAETLRKMADLLDMVGAEVEVRYAGAVQHVGKLLFVDFSNWNTQVGIVVHLGTPSFRMSRKSISLDTPDLTVHAVMDLGEVTV